VIITLDLSLRRGHNQLIDGLNMHIEKGECVFICGQAGSGKTSLLRLFALYDLPAAGRVIIDGRDTAEIARREYPAFWRSLGTVFQDDLLLPSRTIAENIAISLELAGWSASKAKIETAGCLRTLGLRQTADLFPAQVSENERKIAKLCRALARRPKIALADEPFEGLDTESAEKATRLFEEANMRGTTVAITTHNVELAGKLNKRAIMLDKTSLGRMVKATAG
jgi:cell division transport system ATP-binding protein